MPTYPNGQWPRNELKVIPGGTKMGGSALIRAELLPSIIAMQEACLRETGLQLRPTSAADGYRDLATQRSTFLSRYTPSTVGSGPYQDVRTYLRTRYVRTSPKGSAAVPGTSNHGDAEAVDWADMSGRLLEWMNRRAKDFGWENPLWAKDNNPRNGSQEPWHWEPVAKAYAVNTWNDMIGRPIDINPGDRLPEPLIPEDDMSAQDIIDIKAQLKVIEANAAAIANALVTPGVGIASVASDTRDYAVQAATTAGHVLDAVHNVEARTADVVNSLTTSGSGVAAQVVALRAEVAALTEVVRQTSVSGEVDLDAVRRVVDKSLSEAKIVIPSAS